MHAAAAVGCLSTAKELLQAGGSFNVTDANGDLPLHVASRQVKQLSLTWASAPMLACPSVFYPTVQGHLAIVRELLADAGRRSCIKAMNRHGATPLHVAAANGQTEVVRALVNGGAKTDMKDRVSATCNQVYLPIPHYTCKVYVTDMELHLLPKISKRLFGVFSNCQACTVAGVLLPMIA